MLPAVRKPSSGGRFSTIGGAAAAAGGLPGASDCDASLIGFWIFPLRNRKERSDGCGTIHRSLGRVGTERWWAAAAWIRKQGDVVGTTCPPGQTEVEDAEVWWRHFSGPAAFSSRPLTSDL